MQQRDRPRMYHAEDADRPMEPMNVRGGSLADISEELYGRVTKYHAQIGSNVSPIMLQRMEQNMLREARSLFFARKWEDALNTFTHCLAITEKAHPSVGTSVQGVVVLEIASCLHFLSEFDAAKAYYEQAIECLRRVQPPNWEQWAVSTLGRLSGVRPPDIQSARIQFIKSRLVDLELGRPPDLVYLDDNGQRRRLPEIDEDSCTATSWDSRPAWLASAQEYDDDDDDEEEEEEARRAGYESNYSTTRHCNGGSSMEAATDEADERFRANEDGVFADSEEEEAARREWLQYHLACGEWDKAAELVATDEEQQDLEYLMGRTEH